jgi:L-ribulose-5-phosphate 3-epimerase/hexulose-6-phosphate isomerase
MDYAAPMVIEMWAQDDEWANNIQLAKTRLTEMGQAVGFALT